MTRHTAVLVLACLLPQDESWIDQLRDGDIAARDAAERKLVAAGPAALPLLEPLTKSADDELRQRAVRIVETIRDNDARDRVFRSANRVSLDARARPFRDVMKELGIDVWIDRTVEDRAITMSVKDATLLEAISRLCRAHGAARIDDLRGVHQVDGLTWRLEAHDRRARFMIRAGASTKAPEHFAGPFRVSLDSIQRCRTTSHPWQFFLTISATWPPDVSPIGREGLHLDVLRDDAGRDLIPKEGVRCSGVGAPRVGPTLDLWDMKFCVLLKDEPPDDAKALARVEGRVPLWFARARPGVLVEKPAARLNQPIELGDLLVTIKSVEPEVRCAVEWRKGQPAAKAFEWATHFVHVALLDDSGKEIRFTGGNSPTEWNARLADGQLAAIRLSAWSDFYRLDVPFLFTDVPLPQW